MSRPLGVPTEHEDKDPGEEAGKTTSDVMSLYGVRRIREQFEKSGLEGWKHASLMTGLMRITQRLQRRMSDLLTHKEIDYSEYLVLQTLFVRGPHRPLLLGRIAKRMLVHPSTITKRIENLEKLGTVRRDQAAKDRRAVLVTLTDEGVALIHEINRELAEAQYGLKGVSEADSMEILRLLLPVLVELPTGSLNSSGVP